MIERECPICTAETNATWAADQVCEEHLDWHVGVCWCCGNSRFAVKVGDLCRIWEVTLYGELTDSGPPAV